MRGKIYNGDVMMSAIDQLIKQKSRKRWPIWHYALDIVMAICWYCLLLAILVYIVVILI